MLNCRNWAKYGVGYAWELYQENPFFVREGFRPFYAKGSARCCEFDAVAGEGSKELHLGIGIASSVRHKVPGYDDVCGSFEIFGYHMFF